MNKKLKYFPPIKYLIQIVLGVIGFAFFLYISIIQALDSLWANIFFFIFSFILLIYSYLFYRRCFSEIKGFKIELDENFMVLPFIDDGNRIKVFYKDIIEVDTFDTYETKVIVINTKPYENYFFEIEKNFMKKKDFEKFYGFLRIKETNNDKDTNKQKA